MRIFEGEKVTVVQGMTELIENGARKLVGVKNAQIRIFRKKPGNKSRRIKLALLVPRSRVRRTCL